MTHLRFSALGRLSTEVLPVDAQLVGVELLAAQPARDLRARRGLPVLDLQNLQK